MTNKEEQEVIKATIRMITACPIPVRWLSRSVMPGGGERKSRMRGSNGYEIMSRCEYEPGDDPRDIDWAATAQTGGHTIIVRQDAEPREIDVYVLADVSPTMNFGTTRTTKRGLLAELAGSVVKSAGKTQDRVGLIAYSQHNVVLKRRPGGASRALYPIVADIVTAKAESKTIKPEIGTAKGSGLTKSLSSLPRKRSLVFVISDFISLTDQEKAALKRAASRHDVVCVVVQDLRERQLPEGWGPTRLVDLGTGKAKTIWLSNASRAAYATNFDRHKSALLADLKAAHCDTAVFSTEEGRRALQKMMSLFGGHRR